MSAFTRKETSHGCVDTPGFRVSGIHCDVRDKKDNRLDLALIVSDKACTAAGVFTRNRVAAAPVRLNRKVLSKGGPFTAIVANSGNANACTGPEGMTDAADMQVEVAARLGCLPDAVFVCSTGRIGKRLPMTRIKTGIGEAAARLDSTGEAGWQAADAILTSDTRRKVCSVEFSTPAGVVHISGMAKGAGMIEPNMATMLAFLCTDAEIEGEDLQGALAEATGTSFNAVTVDGDESTNDTVLLLANGASEVRLHPGMEEWSSFQAALLAVCEDLARKIVGDGEKITKVVEITVQGAASTEDANLAARAVANSLLVKSSWYGNDPNWGRVMDALGYSGAELSEDSTCLWYADYSDGEPVAAFLNGRTFPENLEAWRGIVAGSKFRIIADLGHGEASCRVWSTDLTEGYVNFNKSE